jgi:hypothetical protein
MPLTAASRRSALLVVALALVVAGVVGAANLQPPPRQVLAAGFRDQTQTTGSSADDLVTTSTVDEPTSITSTTIRTTTSTIRTVSVTTTVVDHKPLDACANTPPTQMCVSPSGDATVHGRVLDQAGNGLGGVCISASDYNPKVSTTTNSEGFYSAAVFINAPPDFVDVLATDCDQQSAPRMAVQSQHVRAYAGGDYGVDFATIKPSTVYGQILRADGTPLAGGCITYRVTRQDSSGEPWTEYITGTTDTDGRYRLNDLPTGTFLSVPSTPTESGACIDDAAHELLLPNSDLFGEIKSEGSTVEHNIRLSA